MTGMTGMDGMGEEPNREGSNHEGVDAARFGRFITSFDEANIGNAIHVDHPVRSNVDYMIDINPRGDGTNRPGGKEQE